MTPTLLTTLTTTSPPTTLLFPTKTYILFSTHTKITIHNTTTQKNIVELTKHNWTINALATTKDTEKIVSAGRGTECFLWDTKTAHVERKIIAHESKINAVAFAQSKNVLATGAFDTLVKLWDIRSNSQKPIQVLKEATDAVTDIHFAHDDTFIYTASIDGHIRSYDLRNKRVIQDNVGGSVTSIDLSKDGLCVLANTLQDTIRLIDRDTGELLSSYQGHISRDYSTNAVLNQNDSAVIAGSEDGSVFAWDLVEEKVLFKLSAHDKIVTRVAACRKSTKFASGGADNSVKIWNNC